MSLKSIDINCDLGESFGAYRLGLDFEVMRYISSANVACGWHAGDSMVMSQTVEVAVSHGLCIGAHPGYPDLVGFGRRHMDCSPKEIQSYVTYQVGALYAFCLTHLTDMTHVKPHGALYHRALNDERVAHAICNSIAGLNNNLDLFVLAGPRGDRLASIADSSGISVCREAFPDRHYSKDGSLVSRDNPKAVISDPSQVSDRAIMMALEGRIEAVDGSVIDLEAQSLCVHGDNESALSLVRAIRAGLEAKGFRIESPRRSRFQDGANSTF